ncbi:hypothetical protein [Pontibacter cellulosilyticus]|uniref:Uncharacterized protein n=1 Tax=Pontibacter cellulosilyticus TaxID=1720253 RepID=A0A923N601_9BACT|nr:hypothetical protein [Pontibacter cellulosilyticus]MBC5992809.1 hypothetical protein [Pontibacter cellulosilyticus]
MILTLRPYPKLSKLNFTLSTASSKLEYGEQYLIQTVDKKLSLTTHRLILRKLAWTKLGFSSIKLEDIEGWEVKVAGNSLYFGLSMGMAFMVYFNDSFALLSGFFLMLFFMTRNRRVHIKTHDGVMILPLEIEEKGISNLIEMVRKAKHARQSQLQNCAA